MVHLLFTVQKRQYVVLWFLHICSLSVTLLFAKTVDVMGPTASSTLATSTDSYLFSKSIKTPWSWLIVLGKIEVWFSNKQGDQKVSKWLYTCWTISDYLLSNTTFETKTVPLNLKFSIRSIDFGRIQCHKSDPKIIILKINSL